MLRLLVPLAAGFVAAVGLWLMRGGLALASDVSTLSRIALLAGVHELLAFGAVVLALLLLWRPAPARVLPLFLLILLVLPWIPGPIPAAFLVWSGRVPVLVCLAVILLAVIGDPRFFRMPKWVNTPGRAPLLAGGVGAVLYVAAAGAISPVLPGGDEPHYLVITQSLLKDRNLRVEENYRRGDYRDYFTVELRPHYLRRGTDGEIYSVHAPGLPAVIAPSFALAGHPGAMVFLALVAAAGTALAWRAAYAVTGSMPAAWFGWAVVALTTPFFFHAFKVYPDALASVLTLSGFWAVVARAPRGWLAWLGHGTALALLPWLHSRYAVLAGMMGLLLLWRIGQEPDARRKAAAFLATPAISAIAWFAFFHVTYGELNPAAPYGGYTQTAWRHVPAGLVGLSGDHQFGLFANAPAYLVAFAGLMLMLIRSGRPTGDAAESAGGCLSRRSLGLVLLATVGPYLLLASAYAMWWGGRSAPARFAVPVLLLLAVPAAVFWKEARSAASRALAALALLVSVLLTAVFVTAESGWLLYDTRDGSALWLRWINPLVDLPAAMPSIFRDGPGLAALKMAVWIVLGGLLWLMLRQLEQRSRAARSEMGVFAAAGTAVLIMLATTAGWRLAGAAPLTSETSRMALLNRYDPARHPVGMAFHSFRLVVGDPVALMHLRVHLERNAPPVLSVPGLPAGTYRLTVSADAPVPATLQIRVGRSPFGVIESIAPGELNDGAVTRRLHLPVGVTSLVVESDRDGEWPRLEAALQPLSIPRPGDRLSQATASRARRYGGATVYFLDPMTYMEPEGFWIAPGPPAEFIVRADRPAPSARLFVRNGLAENRLRLAAGRWRQDLTLAPRQEELVLVPFSPGKRDALIRMEAGSGVRPIDVEPDPADARLLACWVEIW